MSLRDVARDNPRLKANVSEVVESFEGYLAETPNARIHWVEEYARVVVDGAAHRAGLVAITPNAVVLSWKQGLLYRQRALREVPRSDVTDWDFDDTALAMQTIRGPVRIEFRPASPEMAGFRERLELIRPFGRWRAGPPSS